MMDRKFTYAEAGAFLSEIRTDAKVQGTRLGQQLMNILCPTEVNPEIFYSTNEDVVLDWFYKRFVHIGYLP